MRSINKVIVHCSDSDYSHHDNIDIIREWHTKERKWKDIGYHIVITKNGDIYQGRRFEEAGAHCRGYNSDSIGICLTGKIVFSKQQFESLRDVIKELKLKFGTLGVYPHSHFDKSKSCPNFILSSVLD